MKLSAFPKYGKEAASTRQRLLQYVPRLEAAGIAVESHPLLDDDYVRSLAQGGRFSRARVARAYAARLATFLNRPAGDVLWIYAELFPYLPAGFERLAFRSGKPVVYDFDDAFFHQYDENAHPLVRRILRGKLEPLIRGATFCCCGNAYLQAYARRLSGEAVILPTVVDTDVYLPRRPLVAPAGPLVIGWIGSPSTWRYVRPLLPLLKELCETADVRIRIVGAGAHAAAERFEGLELVEWREETEVAEVQRMDIGIMPLPDEPWAKGKSGYKLIQYMACGVPVIASPVGVNNEIVQPGVNGCLATTEPQWRAAFSSMIADPALRRRMGEAGRERAVRSYSLDAYAPFLIDLIRSAAAGA